MLVISTPQSPGTDLEYADCLESDEALVLIEWFRKLRGDWDS